MNRVRRPRTTLAAACLAAVSWMALAIPASAQTPAAEKLTVSASFEREIYERDLRYENALKVMVLKADKPVQSATVEVSVWAGPARLFSGAALAATGLAKTISGTTDANGVVSFGLDTSKLDTDEAIETIAVQVTAKTVANGVTTASGVAKALTALGSPFQQDFGSSRVSSEVFLGMSMEQGYDKDGKSEGFKENSAVGRFRVDTLYGMHKKNKLHTGLEIQFSSFPKTTTQANPDQPNDPDKVTDFADTYTGSLVLLYQPGRLARYSGTTTDPKRPYDAFSHGIIMKAGASSRDSKTPEGDNTIMHARLGYYFSHHQTLADKAVDDNVNVFPMRFVEISYGYYEEIFDKHNANRLIVEAGLRLPRLGNQSVPFYAGLYLNAGEGQDDFRVYAGLLFHLDQIPRVFR